MLLCNLEEIPGKKIEEVLGVVMGNTIRAKHVGKDIRAGFKSIVGGELSDYTEMLTESRMESLKRMTEEAEKLGADAVVNIRFTTSSVAAGAAEILAYGTAVKFK